MHAIKDKSKQNSVRWIKEGEGECIRWSQYKYNLQTFYN